MTASALAIIALTAVYLAALGRVGGWDIAIGAALATVIRWSVRPHALGRSTPAGPSAVSRLAWLGPFIAVLVVRGVGASVRFLRCIRRRANEPGGAFVAIPFGDRTPLGVTVTGLYASLEPGTVLVDVDDEARVMLFQVADLGNGEPFRRDTERFYQRWQRRVAP